MHQVSAIFLLAHRSKVFGFQPGVLRDPGQHSGSEFIAIVKREYVAGPSCTDEYLV